MARVQLFATCLGDLVFPDAVADAEALLRRAGCEVEFPEAQICCGQPAFNSGHRAAARRVARTFVQGVLARAAGRLPLGLVRDDGGALPAGAARRGAVRGLGAVGVPRRPGAAVPRTNEGKRVAYHDSCHMLRELRHRGRAAPAARALRARSSSRSRGRTCAAASAGTFSVRQPEVSLAMADDKLAGASAADALVTADPGCLMHLRGRAEHEARGSRSSTSPPRLPAASTHDLARARRRAASARSRG